MLKIRNQNGGVFGWFLAGLSLIFVVAKLWGIIDWSWWLVFMPIIGPLGLVLIVCGLMLSVALVMKLIVLVVRICRSNF